MLTCGRELKYLIAALSLAGPFLAAPAFAQTREGMISLTREQILAGAKKEGKLFLSPGYDKSTIPHLVKDFTRKYPFIEISWEFVTGIAGHQRQIFEMAAGKSSLDALSPSTAHWSDYFKQNLFKKYDFRGMAKSGQLKIPPQMIDDSGMVAWLGTNMGVFAYNSKLVSKDNAPKGWSSCIDQRWKGKLGVDTKPNTLSWLIPSWGIDRVLDFARRLKDNEPVWLRGQTGSLARLAAGEFALDCGMYLHTARRSLKRDPTQPIALAIPDPVPISFHEPEAIYVKAKNPHAGLLWIDYLASREAQEIVDSADPGKASFLVDGTIAGGLTKGMNLSLCGAGCRDQEDTIIARIAVEAWGLPKVGEAPAGSRR